MGKALTSFKTAKLAAGLPEIDKVFFAVDQDLDQKTKRQSSYTLGERPIRGFDSKTLNTLWVDKNLRTHGLIQAFSRTNRILNAVKSYGNIVCFRNLKDEVDAAITLFGNKEGGGSFLIRPYEEYLGEYVNAVVDLREYPRDRSSSKN